MFSLIPMVEVGYKIPRKIISQTDCNINKHEVRLTFTTDAKLSSKIIISELSLATSVPWMPMERPISA